MRKAVYAGSFDPFTTGHFNIALEAAALFDQVDIVIAINSQKKRRTDIQRMRDAIRDALASHGNINVAIHEGLIADYCMAAGVSYLVRGLRNTSDYMYEENIAKINQAIDPNLKTVYLRTTEEVVSSSMVWELYLNGKSVQKYLPYPEVLLR